MSILFTNGDNETDGGSLELDGASFITSADVGGTTYVFVAGAADGGISVFALGQGGGLTNVFNVADGGTLNLGGVSGLTTITSQGNTYLIAAGATDNGLSVFRVGAGGALTPVYDIADAGSLNLGGVSRLASATVSGNAYVFAAGTNDDGISVFKVAGNGKLTSVYDLADNGTLKLDGVKGLTTATIGGNTFLFAAGGVDDGVSVFNVAANGSLINTSNVGDDATLKLDGASDVATAVVGGTTYLFVTGAVDNGVSVFSVNGSGVLTNVANVTDTAALRLAGATGVTASVFGTTTYLTVGGTENGVSVFRVNTGGTLTFMDNIDDAGARELAGTTQVHTASVGGTNYLVAAGSTDDGVSTFGLHPSGQLWYGTDVFSGLGDGNTRIVRVNNDGSSQTVIIDNSPATDPLPNNTVADLALDTAAGFYYAIINNGTSGTVAYMVRGVIGSSAAPIIVADYRRGDIAGDPDDSLHNDDVIVNALQIDTINHRIYVGYQDGSGSAPAATGIRAYSYNPLTGAVTDLNFLVTSASDSRGQEGGADVLDPRDFALDASIGRLFYTEQIGGLTMGLFRLDLSSPNTTTQLVSQAQFPDDSSNGYIQDVEVDTTTDLVYFTTHSNEASPGTGGYVPAQNALWYISENASSGTAIKVTLVGAVGSTFYPGDMTFDQSLRQLYVESEETDGNSNDDVIYVFQLNGAGTTATLINTLYPSPLFTATNANIQGMTFAQVATLSGLNGTASQMAEQGSDVVLLTGAPAISDTDGDHLAGATVQITGGKFSSNEASTADDHLAWGASLQVSGLISGTNITVAYDTATETLSFTGYDTFANYQAVLAAVRFYSTGDNPTNYGLNPTRTLTWTINDGTPDIPAGGINSGTTQITIAAVNDAPSNSAIGVASGFEDGAAIPITGLQISDPDANPALQTVSVSLSVTKGVLTLLTNVTNGVTAGEVTGNGTSTVTINATLNEINATLVAVNSLLYAGNPNSNGVDNFTVVTNDGGGAGSGGAKSDTDVYTIGVTAVNDAPVVIGDGTETLAATNEDVTNAALINTVATLFGGQYSDSADQVSGGSSANPFAGVAIVNNNYSTAPGQWQYYDGTSWQNLPQTSGTTAVLLRDTAPLRFLAAADYNGLAPTLTAYLVDSSGGALTNGATASVATVGGSTRYSTGTVVLDHVVTPVNDAPVTINGSAVTLTTVVEDAPPSAGETVQSLFASHFSDAKDQVSGGSSANALTGIAVTSDTASPAQGAYQYFDGGAWVDFPTVSTTSALVLDANTLVRFLPVADWSGTPPSLTVYMIEDSAGAVTTGATANLTTTGGATQYGTAMTLGVTVTGSNDAPVASGTATLAAVNEDTAAPAGATVSSLFGSHFSDPDGDTLAGVAITGNAVTSQGVWQYFNGAWTPVGTPSEGAALVLAAGTLVRFLPAANFNGAVPALTAYLIDSSGGAVTPGSFLDVSVNGGQTRFSDVSLPLTTTITAVNDMPVVPATASTVGATEQTPHVLLAAVSVSDVDLGARNGGNGDFGGASFTVQRGAANATDAFAFAASGLFTVSGGALLSGGQPFATFTSSGGVLTISFTSTATPATTALVNDVIEHITYANTSDAPPSSVTLNYVLNDGAPTNAGQGAGGAPSAGGSVIVNITAVNDAHTGGASVTGTPAEDQVLTAVSTLADPDGIGTLHYQWQRDVGGGAVNVGLDQSTYTLGDGDIGGVVRVVIYYTDAGGTFESATSAYTSAISATNDAPTGGVSVTGAATEDQVLTADTSTLNDSDGLGTLHYDWQRDTGSGFASTGAADQATYTLGDADVGGVLRVVVSYTDGQGFANSVTSAATAAVANVNDMPTGGVSITGTATEDQVLTADTSTLADPDGIGTLHYQWQHDVGSGYVNVGTDQATYTLGDGDVGGVVRVIVAYTDGQGTAEAVTSGATAAIANVNDAPTGAVTITGTPTEDQVLTADTSTLADADGLGTLHYDWQRDTGSGFVSTGAADQATYTLGDADFGWTIRVVVAYVDQQGTAEAVTSAATAAIAGINDPYTGTVVINGTATEDQVLTADTSTLADNDGLGPLHYDWQRDVGSGFVSIGAADQATYTLGDADVGGQLRVVVSYTDQQGFAETATSTATTAVANVNDAPTGAVTITGTTTEDQVLTADTSTLADADGLGTLHYDWQRDTGSGFVSTGAADQATYTLGDADVGAEIRVVASYVDQQGTSEAVTSANTAAIAGVNDPHTGGVSINNATTEDQVLTADTSTLADVDGLGALHYDWQRDTGSGFVSIGAADQAAYTLGDADVGAQVLVVVSYTDGQGYTETATSNATATIVNVNDAPTGGVSITGTAAEDQVLTADTSALVDNDGLGTLHYDWQRDTGSGFASIGAADQATYALGDADVGAQLLVVVSYVDGQGTAEAVTSPNTSIIAAVNDPHTGGVTITGTTTEDQVLTANTSTLADPDGLGALHYQWERDTGSGFNAIGAPDQATYTLGDADVGAMVRVVVSYADGQGFAETAPSAATAVIAAINDPHTGGVSITGTTTEDQQLTAVSTLADVDGLGALHYQWQRDTGSGFAAIGAPDLATYTLGDADVGAMVRVVVNYTDGQGFVETATSAATAAIANVNDDPTGTVTISGTVTEDQVLTANTSALADADGLGVLHYQWQRGGGMGFTNVGTDQPTYTLGDADVGGFLRVVVSYVDGHGTAQSTISTATPPVANVNDPHTGGVSISGAATEDAVLTAVSTLADADGLGTLHYSWQRDTGSGFAAIGAPDQATYTLGDADVGATIRVVVNYTDGGATMESATSAATAAVANVNDAPTGAVTLNGAQVEDQVLTADTSTLADADGLGALHYDWQRDTGSGFASIGAPDQTTYTLGDADVGASVRVRVSYIDGHGATETVISATTGAIANINDPPMAADDAGAVTQRLTVTGTVRANDTDVDNAVTALTVSSVAFNFTHANQAVVAGGTVVNGGFGDLTINPDGTYSYQANKEGLIVGQVVTDKFDYTIRDPGGATASAQLTVTITGSATGDANANIIISDGGAHTLTGGGGADTLTGGGGADVFAYNAVGDSTTAAYDTLTDFTHAQDTLSLTPLITGTTKLTLVTDGTNQFLYVDQNGDGTSDGLILSQGQGLQVTDIATGVADFGFSIYGSGNGDILTGGSGKDVVAGYGGDDTIIGSGGADILYGGAGADTFTYGVGDSTQSAYDLISDFATGQDKLNIAAADGGAVTIARFGTSSFVYFGTNGVVHLLGEVQVEDLIVSGATTGVTIYGSYGAETLRGGAGADVLVGGSGTTTLIGGVGADILYGESGTDTFLYQSIGHSNFAAYDTIFGFTSGQDKIDISAIDGGQVTLARYEGMTFIYSAPDSGNNAQSVIAVQGVSLLSTDVITSGGANQAFTLVGDGASHNVADVLLGAGGADILYGLDGDDTLTGDGGADFLIGGTGADTFVYTAVGDSSSIASDLVFDFNSAEGDRIDLTGIDANANTGANDAFTLVSAFSNVAGQLVLGAADGSGYQHLSGDVNGDGVADFVLALQVIGTLDTTHILL